MTTVGGSGNNSDIVQHNEAGDRLGVLYGQVMPNLAEIRHIVDTRYAGKDKVAYARLRAVTYPLQIMTAMKGTDMYGSMIYKEALLARYHFPKYLDPAFDTQELLFDTWIAELDKTIEDLTTDHKFDGEVIPQISLGDQDFIFNGNWEKWAKFANSLKLRLAVRLLHKNKTKALKIASDAFAHSAGLITSTADEFYFYKGPKNFNFGNGIWLGAGRKELIDFFVDNKDPRVRFLFTKNDFNSKVVQQFLNKKQTIPEYINKYIETETVAAADGSDSLVFKTWKAPGEPWVRYQGAPASPDDAQNTSINDAYFKSENFKIKNGSAERTYSPLSFYNEKNIRPNIDHTYPDAPGVVNQEKTDYPYHSVLMSAAEVNLYLAEFKLLGATISGNANDYYQAGIQSSVATMDRLARENGLLYYNNPYDDKHGKAIKLGAGEVTDLLEKDAYKLTGDATLDLEKVYVQQYLNFLNLPTEMFVTSRRSGIPKTGSTILSRTDFKASGTELTVPRRFTVHYPGEDKVNYQTIVDAYTAQGFTIGNKTPEKLNSERIWYDEGAPAWGAGPNY